MKRVIVLIGLLSVCFVTYSQTRFGVNGGMNISKLYNEENDGKEMYESKMGVNFAAFTEHSFNEKIGIQIEVGYTLAGAKLAWFDKDPIDVHYLSMPIVFFYKPIRQIKVFTGPEVNFLLKVKTEISSINRAEQEFEKLDYGISAGLEYQPFSHWSISARNYFGLNYNGTYDILYPDSDEVTRLFKIHRNNIFQISVQYYFKD